MCSHLRSVWMPPEQNAPDHAPTAAPNDAAENARDAGSVGVRQPPRSAQLRRERSGRPPGRYRPPMSNRRARRIAVATVPVVAVGSFTAILFFSHRSNDDPCRSDAYKDAFSVCRSWTESRGLVLVVSLVAAALAGLVMWVLASLRGRQHARDARWAEPNPGNWDSQS